MGRIYRIGEFAELTTVSVRTLHHYDQIGLLQPSAHSEGGHRLYSEEDLLRLQQILTLRFLGFALKEIGALLNRPDFDLVASMQIQRNVLRDRISELEQAEAALGRLVGKRLETGQWDWGLVVKASATVQGRREEKGKSMEKYYTTVQMRQFDELGQQVGPETIRSIEQHWTELMAEVQANPASPEARQLADRWNTLTEETMAHYDGYPELKQAIGENYQQNRFADLEGAPDPAMFAFIQKVNEAHEG